MKLETLCDEDDNPAFSRAYFVIRFMERFALLLRVDCAYVLELHALLILREHLVSRA